METTGIQVLHLPVHVEEGVIVARHRGETHHQPIVVDAVGLASASSNKPAQVGHRSVAVEAGIDLAGRGGIPDDLALGVDGATVTASVEASGNAQVGHPAAVPEVGMVLAAARG